MHFCRILLISEVKSKMCQKISYFRTCYIQIDVVHRVNLEGISGTLLTMIFMSEFKNNLISNFHIQDYKLFGTITRFTDIVDIMFGQNFAA